MCAHFIVPNYLVLQKVWMSLFLSNILQNNSIVLITICLKTTRIHNILLCR